MSASTVRQLLMTALSMVSFAATVVSVPASARDLADADVVQMKLIPGQPLQGGIEHRKKLPKVDERLQVGALFRADMLPDMQPVNDWFRIPSWFAGTWSIETKKVTSVEDFKSGLKEQPNQTIRNKWQGTRGFQRDRKGDIWEYKNVPSVERVDTEDAVDYKLIKGYEPLEVNSGSVLRRKTVTSISVSKLTGRITKISQLETVQKSTPLGPRMIQTESSSKAFGPDGLPVFQQEDVSQSTRTAEFAPRDYIGTKDMRLLFREYLMAHSLPDLVPPDR